MDPDGPRRFHPFSCAPAAPLGLPVLSGLTLIP